MQEVFKFLSTYWIDLLSGVLLVVSIIIALIRKRSVNSIRADLYDYCVYAVKLTEQTELKGDDKLYHAVDIVFTLLEREYPKIGINNYRNLIITIIENILSTPHKKGE